MKKIKLNITDERMLQLPDILKEKGVIRFRQEFCDAIDIPKQNIRNVKNGTQHFTASHIQKACKSFGVNANWTMGTQENVFNKEPITKKLTKKTNGLLKGRVKSLI